jgi:hypothetical protein
MKKLLIAKILFTLGCGTPFFSVAPEVMCDEHCWHIRDCADENSDVVKIDSQLPVGECVPDCMARWDNSEVASAYNRHRRTSKYDSELQRGVNGCEYVEYFSARFGETVECKGEITAVVRDGEFFDCYAR